MTYRQARRRVGSRSIRRAGTNGKVIGQTAKGRAIKRRNPLAESRRNILRVRKLVQG